MARSQVTEQQIVGESGSRLNYVSVYGGCVGISSATLWDIVQQTVLRLVSRSDNHRLLLQFCKCKLCCSLKASLQAILIGNSVNFTTVNHVHVHLPTESDFVKLSRGMVEYPCRVSACVSVDI